MSGVAAHSGDETFTAQRVYVFARDAAFCTRSDAVLAFARGAR